MTHIKFYEEGKTNFYSETFISYMATSKTKLHGWNIPIPSKGYAIITFADGKSVRTQPYKIKTIASLNPRQLVPIPTGRGSEVFYLTNVPSHVKYVKEDYNGLPSKGTLTLKFQDEKPLATLILTKLAPSNAHCNDEGDLYLYGVVRVRDLDQ